MNSEVEKAKRYFEEKKHPVMIVKNIKDTLRDVNYKQALYFAGYHFYSTVDITAGKGAEENYLWHEEAIFMSKEPLEDNCPEVPWLTWKVITSDFIQFTGEIDTTFSIYILSTYPESEDFKKAYLQRQNCSKEIVYREEKKIGELIEKHEEFVCLNTESEIIAEMQTNLGQMPAWKFYQRHKIKKDIRQFQEISRYTKSL